MRLLTMQDRLYRAPTGRLWRLYDRLRPLTDTKPSDYRIVRNVVCAMVLCVLEERKRFDITDN